VLNTPARIDVIEKMGLLGREDADFLRDATLFYRAIDHGLRISSGYAGGSWTSPAQSELLEELVRRWVPERLCDKPLGVKLGEIRQRTREYFNRVFGGKRISAIARCVIAHLHAY
jgi:glutamate-ammonia-ligase adenylyltransferase